MRLRQHNGLGYTTERALLQRRGRPLRFAWASLLFAAIGCQDAVLLDKPAKGATTGGEASATSSVQSGVGGSAPSGAGGGLQGGGGAGGQGGVVAAPTCDDGMSNGSESDVDCGGAECGPCADGSACAGPEDCAGGSCVSGVCCTPVVDCSGFCEAFTSCGQALDCGACPAMQGCGIGGKANVCAWTALDVRLGDGDACALRSDGTLSCWGANHYGQVGDGTSSYFAPVPTAMPPLSQKPLQITAGANHSCVLEADESIWCWGIGQDGQLGTGVSSQGAASPKKAAIANAVDVSAGDNHTCAVNTIGNVLCWGKNNSGQVGDGTYTSKNSPVLVSGFGSGTRVSAGGAHSCAIATDGSLFCWGSNAFGQLGNGTGVASNTAALALALGNTTVDVAAGGHHTCAVKTDGTLRCWGQNDKGQLGDGTLVDQAAPVTITSVGSSVKRVFAGAAHTCVLKLDGSLFCWGQNDEGQLGDGTKTDKATPVQVATLGTTVASVSTGTSHTCAEKTDGTLFCWGKNDVAQLGVASVDNTMPTLVVTSSDVVGVAAGDSHTCAIQSDDSVWCWGGGTYATGLGSSADTRKTPTPVALLGGSVLAASVGKEHACAVQVGGAVFCWGHNDHGQVGDGTTFLYANVPTLVPSLPPGAVAVAVGGDHSCALLGNGTLWCWGDNGSGELGDGTTVSTNAPVKVAALGTSVVQVSAGEQHTCAVTTAGTLFCWGADFHGQVGDGPGKAPGHPVQVLTLGNQVAEVFAGYDKACARMNDGTLWCWGEGYCGASGDGPNWWHNQPIQVEGLSQAVTRVAVGKGHVCAILGDGTSWCFGTNYSGQLGDGATQAQVLPSQVLAMGDEAVTLTAGLASTCALKADGAVWCWGNNHYGQLGNGTTVDGPPGLVLFP